MRSILAGLRQLVLPWGASTGTPRIVLGTDLPPPLNTYLYLGLYSIRAAIIFYGAGASTYNFLALLETGGGALTLVEGGVVGGAVIENPSGIPVGTSLSITSGAGGTASYNIQAGNHFSVNSIYPGLGRVVKVVSTADLGAVGAEATIATLPAATFRDGRAYEARFRGFVTSSIANQIVTFRVRDTNLAGALIGYPDQGVGSAVTNVQFAGRVVVARDNGAGDLAGKVLVLTMQTTLFGPGGTAVMTGNTQYPFVFELNDIGREQDHPEAVLIT